MMSNSEDRSRGAMSAIKGSANIKVSPVKQPRRTLGLLKDNIGQQPDDAWEFPNDLTRIMEGQSES